MHSNIQAVTEEEPALNISDPRVPEVVRQHGLRFKKPARWIVDLGNGEYVLSAADGETLDFVFLK